MLSSFAESLAFEGLPGADIDFDLLRLGFCLLGKADLQYAFVIVGAHLPGIHRAGDISTVMVKDAAKTVAAH